MDDFNTLITYCRSGRLFEIQDLIAKGVPVDAPTGVKIKKPNRPLTIAIEKGFYSLVQVLLDAGAKIHDEDFNALRNALKKRDLDLIKLLVDHGAETSTIKMWEVFDQWNPAIIEYFIELGSDVETGYPLAGALCDKIRPALGVYKRHRERFSTFQEQIDIALRYHCKEGNLKWVSLLLWAGADPFTNGPADDYDEPEPDGNMTAVEYAAEYENFEIFNLKQFDLPVDHPLSHEIVLISCGSIRFDFLTSFLDKGFDPGTLPDQGSSLVQRCIEWFPWIYDLYPSGDLRALDLNLYNGQGNIEKVKLLVEKGARWIPTDKNEINKVRRSLLKMDSDYVVKFIKIMAERKACTRSTLDQLLRTSAIKKHVLKEREEIKKLLSMF